MADDKKISFSMVGVSKAFQANKQVLKDTKRPAARTPTSLLPGRVVLEWWWVLPWGSIFILIGIFTISFIPVWLWERWRWC